MGIAQRLTALLICALSAIPGKTFRVCVRPAITRPPASVAWRYLTAGTDFSGLRDRKTDRSLAMSASTERSGVGRVVVVGSANQDLTAYTKSVPTIGETVLGTSFETCCGGKGANQAVAAASLEICPVSMVCRVGADSFGSDLLANFRRVGVQYDEDSTVLPVDTDSDDPAALHTGVAPIVVDTKTGDNMIIVIPGANHQLTPSDVRKAILSLAEGDTAPPSVVVVQLEIQPETALEALRVGREVGALTILNPAPAPEGWKLEDEFFQYADIIIPNESELRRLHGSDPEDNNVDEEQMASEILNRGVQKAVIVTLGARGAMILSKTEDGGNIRKQLVSAPTDLPYNALPVVDTVGAGDAFCGALSAYISSGLDLGDAATKACGFASMSVRKRGAQSSYPTVAELPDLLKIEGSGPSLSDTAKPLITFVTGNKKKLEEVQRMLSTEEVELPFIVKNLKVDLPELQGDPLEIAKEKCKLAAEEVRGPVLTEDTSLCFNALNGMPGPYIKWFLEKCGHDGLNKMLTGFQDKTAYAQTVVAFSLGPGDEVHVFEGRTDGKIVRPRGSLDFGWDPIFEPDEGGGKTYGEMKKDEKDAISHRGRSFSKFRLFLALEGERMKEALQGK